MHLFDVSRRFFGGNAIVAGGLPMAVGLALADAKLGRRAVTACFFGDGAVAEGEFHESLNLAALWKLPVLFLCENNGCARVHLMATAHLPINAKDGRRMQGLSAERGHAASAKQTAPSPLASETNAGTTTSSTNSAPIMAATRALRGFGFVTLPCLANQADFSRAREPSRTYTSRVPTPFGSSGTRSESTGAPSRLASATPALTRSGLSTTT